MDTLASVPVHPLYSSGFLSPGLEVRHETHDLLLTGRAPLTMVTHRDVGP